MNYLDFRELLLPPFYLGAILLMAGLIRRRVQRPFRPYLVPALSLKLMGAAFVGLIYAGYYGSGDTLTYYEGGMALQDLFFEDPLAYLKVLFSHGETLQKEFPEITQYHPSLTNESALVVMKFASVISFFTFGSYFSISFVYATLSFWGLWRLFKVFCALYPQYHKEMAWAVFFVPSVFFWGSGLLKDTLTLGAVGMMVSAVYTFFFLRRRRLSSLIWIGISGYLLVMVKIYILLGLAPPLMLWVLLNYKNRIRVRALRVLAFPALAALTLFIVLFFWSAITERLTAFAMENVIETALLKATYSARIVEGSGGSAYELGEIEPSPIGVLKSAPRIILLALFRPYLWEVNKIVQFLSGLENFVLLAFTLWLLYKTRFTGFFIRIWRDDNLLFFFSFTLLFGMAVGLSSGNFGNLVRYKIPCIPFFVATLLVIRAQLRGKKPAGK